MLSAITRAFRLETTDREPLPVARLTIRAKDGIWLKMTPRS